MSKRGRGKERGCRAVYCGFANRLYENLVWKMRLQSKLKGSAITEFPVNGGSQYSFYTKIDTPLKVTCYAIINFPDNTSDSVSGEALLQSVKPVATWSILGSGVHFNVSPYDGPSMSTEFGAFDNSSNPYKAG